MKTIKEGIRHCIECLKYLSNYPPYEPESVKHGFVQGVYFAQEWISVDDELPENQDIVLVKTDLGCVTIAYLHGKKSGFIVYGEDAYIEFGNITHWRPIKRK